MSDYRMLAGLTSFIVIVLTVLVSAAADYPELAPTQPGGTWPPVFPDFEMPGWAQSDPDADCEGSIAFELCVIARWIGLFFGAVVGGFVFIAQALVFIFTMLVGLVTFRISGLPPELAFISTVMTVALVVVIALLIFRLIRSVVPFVSGE